jgi:hypothetical protein
MKLKLILTASLLVWLVAIVSYVHADEPTMDRDTATHRLRGAAIAGWTKIAAGALRYGASVDETDEYGTTPLILAAIGGHERITKLLLEAGADANRENDDHVSPILAASANCNDPVVTLLLRRGANPNAKGQTRQTPLMRAAENGCAVTVKVLLRAKGVDVKGADDTGKTALDYAHEAMVLGLDGGDSFALIDDLLRGLRREAIAQSLRRPKSIRKPMNLPRGTAEPRSMPPVPKTVPILD